MRPDDDFDSSSSDEYASSPINRYNPRQGLMTEIIPAKLYLSDMTSANNLALLKKHSIKRIIALGGFHEQPSYIQHKDPEYPLEYHHIYIDDQEREPINQHFEDTEWFINKISGAVLVHCWMGISRSSTICIAYLIKSQDMSFIEAWNYVQERRNFIEPNDGFLAQLEAFAKQH